MGLLIRWVVSTIAIMLTARILPGVHITSLPAAFLAAAVLGIVNAVLKPILLILTLPLTIITLGLFTFVINAFLIILVSILVPGFHVDTFWWALLFSIIASLINSLIMGITKRFE